MKLDRLPFPEVGVNHAISGMLSLHRRSTQTHRISFGQYIT